MNWLMTSLFLLFSCVQYLLLGTAFTCLFGYKRTKGLSIIAGYFVTFGILWIPGMLAQILSLSWSLYFLVSLILLGIADGVAFWSLKSQFHSVHRISGDQILNLLKNNWVIIIFVILFSLWSLANQLSIYNGGYDDFYYIGKIVNNVGAAAIGREEYFNGSILPSNSLISIERICNTYELSYGFFATLFHIEIPFFCRVSITILNYYITGCVFCEFCGLFLKKGFRQYALFPLFILLIPAGGLLGTVEWLPKIYAYDLWQFQTAIFYGGSVVRDLSIPTLLLFSIPMFYRIDIRKIIAVAILTISFLSFSTIILSTFIVFAISIIFIKLIYMGLMRIIQGDVRIGSIDIVGGGLLIVGTAVISQFTEQLPSMVATYVDAMTQFLPFVDQLYAQDSILRWGWLFCVVILFLTRSTKGRLTILFLLNTTLLVSNSLYNPFLMLASANVFFVAMRTLTSVQLLLLLCIGVVPVLLLQRLRIPASGIICPSMTFVIILTMVICFFTNRAVFITNPYLASGVSPYGWGFGRALDIWSRQQAKVVAEVGDYFNSLPYGNYILATAAAVPEEDKAVIAENFMTGSNRIQIIYRNGIPDLTMDEVLKIDEYLSQKDAPIEEVQNLINTGIIDYILVQTDNKVQELQNLGFSPVLHLSNGGTLLAWSDR